MGLFSIFYGLLLIGIGFFMKKYPSSMAGYNTMSTKQKRNVDIVAIATLYKKGFIVIGIVTIIGAQLFLWLGFPIAATVTLIAPLFIGILILTIITQKYDHNKQSKFKKYIPIAIICAISVIITVNFIYTAKPTRVEISGNDIEFTGKYGVTIQATQIEKVELLDHIPHIKLRTNGVGLGNILKGHFMLDKFGRCRLYLRLPNPPYLYVELNNGNKIIFNSTEPHYTKEAYLRLQNSVLESFIPIVDTMKNKF